MPSMLAYSILERYGFEMELLWFLLCSALSFCEPELKIDKAELSAEIVQLFSRTKDLTDGQRDDTAELVECQLRLMTDIKRQCLSPYQARKLDVEIDLRTVRLVTMTKSHRRAFINFDPYFAETSDGVSLGYVHGIDRSKNCDGVEVEVIGTPPYFASVSEDAAEQLENSINKYISHYCKPILEQ